MIGKRRVLDGDSQVFAIVATRGTNAVRALWSATGWTARHDLPAEGEV